MTPVIENINFKGTSQGAPETGLTDPKKIIALRELLEKEFALPEKARKKVPVKKDALLKPLLRLFRRYLRTLTR